MDFGVMIKSLSDEKLEIYLDVFSATELKALGQALVTFTKYRLSSELITDDMIPVSVDRKTRKEFRYRNSFNVTNSFGVKRAWEVGEYRHFFFLLLRKHPDALSGLLDHHGCVRSCLSAKTFSGQMRRLRNYIMTRGLISELNEREWYYILASVKKKFGLELCLQWNLDRNNPVKHISSINDEKCWIQPVEMAMKNPYFLGTSGRPECLVLSLLIPSPEGTTGLSIIIREISPELFTRCLVEVKDFIAVYTVQHALNTINRWERDTVRRIIAEDYSDDTRYPDASRYPRGELIHLEWFKEAYEKNGELGELYRLELLEEAYQEISEGYCQKLADNPEVLWGDERNPIITAVEMMGMK